MENTDNNNESIPLYEQYNNRLILRIPYDENTDIFQTIENMLENLNNNPDILSLLETSTDEYFHLGIQFDTLANFQENNIDDEEEKYFKSCKEINEKISKSNKIKKDDQIIGEQCFICMDNYKEKEFKRELPKCKHCFHKKCIDKWLKKKSNCPICRDNLL